MNILDLSNESLFFKNLINFAKYELNRFEII